MSLLNTIPAPNTSFERERAYFDQLVLENGEFNPFAERGWKTLAGLFEHWIVRHDKLDILDVGCGTGQSRQIYVRHASSYVGLDLSAEAIAIAQRRFSDSKWIVGNACLLPFESASFDVVAFSSVLHHIPDLSEAVAEAVRVLRPGGRAFAFDPNLLHPAMALFRHPRSPLYCNQGVSPDECPLLPSVLWRAFDTAGLVHVRQRGQSNIPYRQVAPRFLNAMLALYNAADRVWALSGLGRWFGTFLVTCGEKPAELVSRQATL